MPTKGSHHSLESRRKMSESHNKGWFKNGHIPWNEGKTSWNKGLTKETDLRVKKQAESMKGNQHNKGKHYSEDHRHRISESLKGNTCSKGRVLTELHKKRISISNKGRKFSELHKQKLREAALERKPNHILKNTSIEVALQKELNGRGIIYETHIPICKTCTPDIVFPDKKVVVQCDGDYWHNYPHGTEKDRRQDKVLRENGWQVLRFWGSEIKEDVSGCVDMVEAVL